MDFEPIKVTLIKIGSDSGEKEKVSGIASYNLSHEHSQQQGVSVVDTFFVHNISPLTIDRAILFVGPAFRNRFSRLAAQLLSRYWCCCGRTRHILHQTSRLQMKLNQSFCRFSHFRQIERHLGGKWSTKIHLQCTYSKSVPLQLALSECSIYHPEVSHDMSSDE